VTAPSGPRWIRLRRAVPLECWGVHAMAESSFFATLKRELIDTAPS
jgi:hypothetical protein